jgi:O-antigen/teichoic acid export membrane protein
MLRKIKPLLLENRSLRQALLKNSFWIGISEVFNKSIRAVLLIYLARVLGASEYGKFSFALSFVSVFVSFLDLGLSSIITREFSKEKIAKGEFSSLFTLKIFLGIFALLVVFFSSFFITAEPVIRRTIWILAGFSFITQFPEFLYAFWRAKQRMEYEAWANVFIVITMVACVFIVIFNFPSLENVAYGYLLSGIFSVVLLFYIFNHKFIPLSLKFEFKDWKRFLLMSWPLALTSVFGMLYSYIDSIIMGFLNQMIQTGWYNASLKIIYLLSAPIGIISLNFYPLLSRFAHESKERFQNAWNYQMAIVLALVMPIIFGGVALADKIILFFYGDEYLPSAQVFKILIFVSALTFLCSPFTNALVAANQQKKTFLVSLIGAFTSIILNLLLIPRFSLYGAAFASVASYIVMLYLYFRITKVNTVLKPFNEYIFRVLAIAVVTAVSMLIIITLPQVYNLNLIVIVIIGTLAYGGVFFMITKLLHQLTTVRLY